MQRGADEIFRVKDLSMLKSPVPGHLRKPASSGGSPSAGPVASPGQGLPLMRPTPKPMGPPPARPRPSPLSELLKATPKTVTKSLLGTGGPEGGAKTPSRLAASSKHRALRVAEEIAAESATQDAFDEPAVTVDRRLSDMVFRDPDEAVADEPDAKRPGTHTLAEPGSRRQDIRAPIEPDAKRQSTRMPTRPALVSGEEKENSGSLQSRASAVDTVRDDRPAPQPARSLQRGASVVGAVPDDKSALEPAREENKPLPPTPAMPGQPNGTPLLVALRA